LSGPVSRDHGIRWYGLSPAERRELLIPMLKQRMTYGQIGAVCGVSRNLISGFIFRNMKDVKDRPRKRIRYKWTPERTAMVYELARAGHKAEQIAAMMPGRKPSASSVYERLRPLRKELKATLPPKPSPDEQAAARNRERANERRAAAMMRVKIPKAVPLPKLREIPVAAPKPFIDRRISFECAWIVGDPRDADPQCCGAPVPNVGASWCQAHREIVFGRPA